MKNFKVKYLYQGKTDSREFFSDSESQLIIELHNKGFSILSIQETLIRKNSPNRFIKPKLLVNYFSSIRQFLESDIEFFKALESSTNSAANQKTKAVFEQISREVAGGANFATVLKNHLPLTPIMVSLLESADKGADLVMIIKVIESRLKQSATLRTKLISTSVYPLMILGLSFVGIILLSFVFGSSVDSFVSNLVQRETIKGRIFTTISLLLIVPIIMTLGVLGIRFAVKHNNLTTGLHRWLMKVPIYGSLFKLVFTENFIFSIKESLKTSLTLEKAFSNFVDSLSDKVIKDQLADAHEKFKSGASLSQTISKKHFLTPDLDFWIRLGEESKNLPRVLESYHSKVTEKLQTKLESIQKMIEPLLTVLTGGILIILIVFIILPIIQSLISI